MPTIFPEDSGHPVLPEFKTLLIRGPYPPSAPFHLCLSHINERHVTSGVAAIVLTPSKRQIIHSLKESTDPWLLGNSGTGSVVGLSRHIKMFYPPTPRHLCLLLAMFHVAEPSNESSWHPTIAVSSAPTLIVLHELSAYYLPVEEVGDSAAHSSQPTLASYLTLVSDAMAAASFLSSSSPSVNTRFALFDSGLDSLQLPILRSPQPSHVHAAEPDDFEDTSRVEVTSLFVQKYFEYCVVFSSGDGTTVRTLRLMHGEQVIHEYTM